LQQQWQRGGQIRREGAEISAEPVVCRRRRRRRRQRMRRETGRLPQTRQTRVDVVVKMRNVTLMERTLILF